MPALCSFLLRGNITERDNLIVRAIKEHLFTDPAAVAAIAMACHVRRLAAFSRCRIFIFIELGADFIPKLDEGTFTMMVYRAEQH